MTKRQIIEQIRDINCSADPAFLSEFNDIELGEYLSHLRSIKKATRTNFPTRLGPFYVSEAAHARKKHSFYVAHPNRIDVGHRQLALTM